MSVVKVDSTRRIYIPKELPFEAEKAVIITHGASYLLIPVPQEPIPIDIKQPVSELKLQAEQRAKKDAVQRAKRRNQL